MYILCVHIEGRVVGSRKRGSSKKGSKNISTSKGVLIKEGDKRGMNRGSTNISKNRSTNISTNNAYTLGVLIERISLL